MAIDINEIAQLIGTIGFPIVMCGYMAVKFDKTLAENTKAIQSLIGVISHLVEKEDHVGLSILKDSDTE